MNLINLKKWQDSKNFGDDLSPWLVERISNKKCKIIKENETGYLVIGSIINKVKENDIVWGSGAFGVETKQSLCKNAKYLAVRGPLTQNLLSKNGIKCPRIYGDPALLIDKYFKEKPKIKYKYGVALRWREYEWKKIKFPNDILMIDFKTNNVEKILNDILSCEVLITSSLHGLIIADVFNIPSIWLYSDSPLGKEFKFYDYFISVDKIREPLIYNLSNGISKNIIEQKMISYICDKNIEKKKNIICDNLMKACPF